MVIDHVKQFGKIEAIRTMVVKEHQIASHYGKFSQMRFFPTLVSYYAGQSIQAVLLKVGESSLASLRESMGPAKVAKGSFRDALVGDCWQAAYAQTGVVDNGIHCSDCLAEGLREKAIWFEQSPIGYEDYANFVRSNEHVIISLTRLLRAAATGAGEVLVNVKEWASVQEKIVRKGYTSLAQFKDIIRAAVLFLPKTDRKTAVARVTGLAPKYGARVAFVEKKKATADNPYGGATHVDLVWDNNVSTEVIVTTRTLWHYKEEAHKVYKGEEEACNPHSIFRHALKGVKAASYRRARAYTAKRVVLPELSSEKEVK